MARSRYFGTDGVRGKISDSDVDDPIHSFHKKGIFSSKLCNEISYHASSLCEDGGVIVGWDRRLLNAEKAHELSRFLCSSKRVFLLGETTTPALQHEMVRRQAAMGIMITASHNPSTDTGLKIMFENGRKPTLEEESYIESNIFESDIEVQQEPPFTEITNRRYLDSVTEKIRSMTQQRLFPENEVLIDGAGGWISTWLAKVLASCGVRCIEVGNRDAPINANSGAGGLKEGRMSWKECLESSHKLLSGIAPVPRGTVIGFTFDGDGDRCYMVCSAGDEVLIVGGDGFMRLFLESDQAKEKFNVALTIESSLDLIRHVDLHENSNFIQTGVGDRWLQHALIERHGPFGVGAEPSGHVVLKHSVGDLHGYWGDGVETMLQFLILMKSCGPNWIDIVVAGTSHTISRSISPSNKGLWKPNWPIAEKVKQKIADWSDLLVSDLDIYTLKGEESLLMVNFNHKGYWSVTVRNSGTEQKTRITIRTSTIDKLRAIDLMDRICEILARHLLIT